MTQLSSHQTTPLRLLVAYTALLSMLSFAPCILLSSTLSLVFAYSPTACRSKPTPSSFLTHRAGSLSDDVYHHRRVQNRNRRSILLSLSGQEDETNTSEEKDDGKTAVAPPKDEMNPFAQASWYAAEALGKVFGNQKSAGATFTSSSLDGTDAVDLTRKPQSLKEALKRIELDNERSYFLSGDVDKLAYDEDCVFADPFVSFSGRDRFVENLANLGSFITDYDARMLKYEVNDDGTQVKTKLMVKLELNLPWKPILAWPWGVTYDIDPETFLIANHQESWDIEPWEGVKQVFRKPTTRISKKES